MKKAGLEVDVKTGMKLEELKACIAEYSGLVIRSATKVTSEIIDAAVNLRVIGRAGSGLDNVDKAAASKKGIVVMNTPGGNTVTTAEHSIAMLFASARLIPQATASMKAGKWEKKKFMGVELYHKTLGVVGLGNIGGQVARKALGLEMNVIAFDPFLSEETAKASGQVHTAQHRARRQRQPHRAEVRAPLPHRRTRRQRHDGARDREALIGGTRRWGETTVRSDKERFFRTAGGSTFWSPVTQDGVDQLADGRGHGGRGFVGR